jgi:regulatory protein
MSVVTALVVRGHGLAHLSVDGDPVGTASADLVARWRLYEGRRLDASEVEQLLAEIAVEDALADAARFLQRRLRSRAEVERHLLGKGHTHAVVDAALVGLGRRGLVNDAEFARAYIADKRHLSGWGRVRIERGLAAYGVDAEITAAALAEAEFSDDAELRRALLVLQRKGAPQGPPEAAKRRAYQTLLRRGFAASVALSAVRSWYADVADGEPD